MPIYNITKYNNLSPAFITQNIQCSVSNSVGWDFIVPSSNN